MHITKSLAAYEGFLRHELGAEIVEKGLKKKRKDMRGSAFAFLRASFWRWAETVRAIVPTLMTAPTVLGVGDIHLENFGTWRDADGRLVWGVNDFDEAATMPYPLDLLRLATSALLAAPDRHAPAEIAEHLLGGYRKGLRAPRPFILDREHRWLREAVIVPEDERARFWDKLAEKRAAFEAKPAVKRPALPPRYHEALLAALPSGAEAPACWYRSAGLGSLGRPRWVAEAEWRGEVVLREAKGIVRSAWTLPSKRGGHAIRCMEIATGRYRAPDPHYRVADGIAVRRLSPNSRKINAEGDDEDGIGIDRLLSRPMLAAMGAELAAIHLGTGDAAAVVSADFDGRADGWLAPLAMAMASAIEADFRALD